MFKMEWGGGRWGAFVFGNCKSHCKVITTLLREIVCDNHYQKPTRRFSRLERKKEVNPKVMSLVDVSGTVICSHSPTLVADSLSVSHSSHLSYTQEHSASPYLVCLQLS